jgi:hypothetical protein
MSTTQNPTYAQVDRAIRGLKDFEQEQTLLPESFEGHVARLVRIYASAKPLLTMLAALPLFPPTWRKAITYLTTAIDAVAAGAGSVTASFKAGKDI